MTNRQCTWCGCGEMYHYGHECMQPECLCDGFTAREISLEERRLIVAEKQRIRGQTSNNAVADQYSEIREHLAKVMDRAIKE